MKQKLHKQYGFTLIEVMVVVVILGILAAILVPKVMDRPDQARKTKARQDIRALEAALQLYKLDNFVYPTTDQGLEALTQKHSGMGLGRGTLRLICSRIRSATHTSPLQERWTGIP